MNNELVPVNAGSVAYEPDKVLLADDFGAGPTPVELSVAVLRDAKLRAETASDNSVSLNGGVRGTHEIILSGRQLLTAAVTILCSIFFFVWALIRLWLAGR